MRRRQADGDIDNDDDKALLRGEKGVKKTQMQEALDNSELEIDQMAASLQTVVVALSTVSSMWDAEAGRRQHIRKKKRG